MTTSLICGLAIVTRGLAIPDFAFMAVKQLHRLHEALRKAFVVRSLFALLFICHSGLIQAIQLPQSRWPAKGSRGQLTTGSQRILSAGIHRFLT